MKYIIFLLLVLCTANVFAQSLEKNINIDTLRNELTKLSQKNIVLARELDSIKTELKVNSVLIEAEKSRSMETLEYASKIIDWSAWILAVLGILFVIIGFTVGYFGLKEIRSFHKIRKKMGRTFKVFQKDIDEFKKTSKNLINIIYWSTEGWNKYVSGNYDRAEFLFKQIKNIRANDYETCYRLGKVYTSMRKFKEATKEFEQAIIIDPNIVDAYFGLGWNHKNQKSYNEAIENYKNGLKISVSFYGLCGLGHVYMEANRLTEARDCFIHSIEENPNSGSTFPLGNIFLFESNEAKAIDYYKQTLELTGKEIILKPDYFWAYYNKVGAEIGLNKISSAKKSLEKALSKNSGLEILKNILFQFDFMKKIKKLSPETDYFLTKLTDEIIIRESGI